MQPYYTDDAVTAGWRLQPKTNQLFLITAVDYKVHCSIIHSDKSTNDIGSSPQKLPYPLICSQNPIYTRKLTDCEELIHKFNQMTSLKTHLICLL